MPANCVCWSARAGARVRCGHSPKWPGCAGAPLEPDPSQRPSPGRERDALVLALAQQLISYANMCLLLPLRVASSQAAIERPARMNLKFYNKRLWPALVWSSKSARELAFATSNMFPASELTRDWTRAHR